MRNEPAFITLSEALSWLAFGKQYKKEALVTHIAENDYSEYCKEKLENALTALISKARGALIDLEGKKTISKPPTKNNGLTLKIAPITLADFAAFDVTTGGLRYGQGLLWLPELSKNNALTYQLAQVKRPEHYADVHVSFSQLKKELQPGRQSLPALSAVELEKWWDGLSEEEKRASEKAHEKVLTENFPNNHVARRRLRAVRASEPRRRGRPKEAKK